MKHPIVIARDQWPRGPIEGPRARQRLSEAWAAMTKPMATVLGSTEEAEQQQFAVVCAEVVRVNDAEMPDVEREAMITQLAATIGFAVVFVDHKEA